MGQNHKLIWAPQPGPQTMLLQCPYGDILYGGARGSGKFSPLDSKVLTPLGFVEMGSLKVGDAVSDPTTGGTCKVVAVYPQGVQPIWRLTFDDGASLEVGDEHLWAYRQANHPRPFTKASVQRAYATECLGATPLVNRWDRYRVGTTRTIRDLDGVRIPLTEPLAMTKNGRANTGDTVPPYMIGLFLGDGSCGGITLTTADEEIFKYIETLGFYRYPGEQYACGVRGPWRKTIDKWLRSHGLKSSNREFSRSWEKHIPEYIFTLGIPERTEVLCGLMDTDGTVDKGGHASFTSTSLALAKGVQALVRGLGGKAKIHNRQKKYSYKGELRQGRPSFDVIVWHPKLSSLFKLLRKRARCTDSWNGGHEITRELVRCEYVGEKEAQCIRVGSMYGLYVADDYIVTHNSDACLGEWLIHAGKYGPTANGMMFRRHLHELDPIIRRSQELYSGVGRYLKQQKTWEFHNGATITFRHLDSVEDSDLYKGASFTRLYFEELADWPDHAPRMRMNGTLRSAAGVPAKCISTGNPGGPGQGWVKECYIDPAPKGMVPVHDDFRDIAGWERVFVPATSADNQILMKNDPSYLQRLASVGSAALARAWILGDWDSVEGAFFSDYNAGVHVVSPLSPPSDWTRFRALDWGSEAPFCCLWFAVSDGSVSDFPREALIVYREWYERGARLSAEQFAQGIIDRTEMPQSYTEADPSIFREDGGPSIAERMADTGIVCCPADNTRIAGWDQVRGRLKGIDKRPMLYITSNCANLIREISTAQHDRNKIEDVDSSGDDHAIDACRYACSSRPWITQPRITPPQGLRLEDLIKPRGVANV